MCQAPAPESLQSREVPTTPGSQRHVRATLVALGLLDGGGTATILWFKAAKKGALGLADAAAAEYSELFACVLTGGPPEEFDELLGQIIGDRPRSAAKKLRSFVLGALQHAHPETAVSPYRRSVAPGGSDSKPSLPRAAATPSSKSTVGSRRAADLIEAEHTALLALLVRDGAVEGLSRRQILAQLRRLRDEMRAEG